MGTGGASVVHAATDAVTGRAVAVKVLVGGVTGTNARVRREVAALRLLRIPGVVTLLDEGVHAGVPFLVMEKVEGRPFPGADARTWDQVAPVVVALLETLSRVHAAGVVHRDLKPSNVLVGADGRVTVLDFGVSWGPALGAAVTAIGTIVGTPEYLAPEQILGRGADPRSDLYAVGVMLYEALTGRLPHEAREFHRLLELKRHTPSAPLRATAPDVPRAVAEVVDRLLSVDPADRPQTAGETSYLLFGPDPARTIPAALARLGDGTLLDRIVEAAAAGRSFDVWGPVGSGRTRLLADAVERLTAAGRAVRWVPPSRQPYGSVAALLGGFDDLRDASRDEAEAAICARLAALVRGGDVLVADGADRIDDWSAAALEAVRGDGAVLRAFDRVRPTAVEVPALSEEDLRPLFAGPDRIFHLREDGAHELWRRTGGLPGLVVAEVSAWVRAGVAAWKDDLVSVRRDALDRLRGGLSVGDELLLRPGPRARSEQLDDLLAWIVLAWPHATLDVVARASGEPRWRIEPEVDALVGDGLVRRVPDGRVQPLVMAHALEAWDEERRRAAHRALAAALPAGTPLRLRHLAAAAESAEVVREALAIAPGMVRGGRPGDAQIVLEQALEAMRHGAPPATGREADVLTAFAWACVEEGTPAAVDRALYEIDRTPAASRAVRPVSELLRGAREAIAGDAKRAVRILARVGPLADGELELWRHAMRFRAAQRLPVEVAEDVLREFEAWSGGGDVPRARANLCSWRALHLYRCDRPAEAAALHLEAAQSAVNLAGTAASYVNAALALIEAGRIRGALDAACRAEEVARTCRLAASEAWSVVLRRLAAYRLGETPDADPELVSLTAALGDVELEGIAALSEAVLAWRRGDAAHARGLAARSTALLRRPGVPGSAIVSRALEVAAGGDAPDARIDELVREAASSASAAEAAQALGLLAIARPDRAEDLRRAGRAYAAAAGPVEPGTRWDVLSPEEAAGVG